MTSLPIPTPPPGRFNLDWDRLSETWTWLRDLAGCPQDPQFHGEGDVWVHTRMVCEQLTDITPWRMLPPDERGLVLAAALFHDIAKPACTRCDDDGRIRSPGHSRRGSLMAREELYRMGVPFALRESIASLVRHHQYPFYLLERPDARRAAYGVSQTTRCDHLAILAEADMRGRICEDQAKVLDAVTLFRDYCEEEGCLTTPRAFANDVSRFEYFQREDRDPDYAAWDASEFEVVLMSGLPGTGKDHWIRENRPEWPVISLDDIRDEIDAPPTGEQGPVVALAKERARELLRARRGFVWNATNLTRQRRSELVALFTNYRARVRVVYVEAPWEVLKAQNRERARKVPVKAIEQMLTRWEVPDAPEAPEVEWAVRDR
jgi:predicted kinase